MRDRTHEHNNLPQKDKRANLFYLLQELSVATGIGEHGSEVEAPISDKPDRDVPEKQRDCSVARASLPLSEGPRVRGSLLLRY